MAGTSSVKVVASRDTRRVGAREWIVGLQKRGDGREASEVLDVSRVATAAVPHSRAFTFTFTFSR